MEKKQKKQKITKKRINKIRFINQEENDPLICHIKPLKKYSDINVPLFYINNGYTMGITQK